MHREVRRVLRLWFAEGGGHSMCAALCDGCALCSVQCATCTVPSAHFAVHKVPCAQCTEECVVQCAMFLSHQLSSHIED